jgi:hypothetical protein
MSLDIAKLFHRSDDGDTTELVRDLLNVERPDGRTDLKNPSATASMNLLAEWCEEENLHRTARMIRKYLHQYKVDVVSHNRKSRTEVVTAISEIRQQEREVRRNEWRRE